MDPTRPGSATPDPRLERLLDAMRAFRDGDFRARAEVRGDDTAAEIAAVFNEIAAASQAFTAELDRVGTAVRRDGVLGARLASGDRGGDWERRVEAANALLDELARPLLETGRVLAAVARGDLTKKLDVAARGEILELKTTINTMVEQLSSFADEVTRVARDVGTKGILGAQARVPGVSGTWKELTDHVNVMADNLTAQVRNIAQVTTAVARGDLTKKIDVDARGEILELKTTINTMVDRLSAFASEVTRVAREVGTEGKLGGQAEVEDVSGTWQRLTESVNRLAGNLTAQVRAIAEVATAVTAGDLTRLITVDASGEVAELKDDINQMIANLAATTRANREQDWLKTNLARIAALLPGRRDLAGVAALVLDELAPLVSAHSAAFFLAETEDGPGAAESADSAVRLRMIAGFGYAAEPGTEPSFALGQGLVGQVAVQRKTIAVAGAPAGHIRVASGLGHSAATNIIVLPVLFEGRTLGVIELASVNEFTQAHRDFLEQLKETIGVAVNTITTQARTDALLAESQRLTAELQSRQQDLQRSNAELGQKAAQLAEQNQDIEIKNAEIEQARQTLAERAQQLAMAAKVKSDFMANMSHELRTPLNSLLILARLLADNPEGNLSPKQVDFARTIHSAGTDLLELINDILDLSKIEAGRMEVRNEPWPVAELVDSLAATFQPLAADKGLRLEVAVAPDVPATVTADSQRVQQILRNLLSNALKFTDAGGVTLRVGPEPGPHGEPCVAFAVADTGIGIPEEKLELIFEAFQQADTTTGRHFGGTGLGLSISRELTRLLGAELRVESAPGRGSTFTLLLPVVPAVRASDRAVADTEDSAHRDSAQAGASGGIRRSAEADTAARPSAADTGEPAPAAGTRVLILEPPGISVLAAAAESALESLGAVRDLVGVVRLGTTAELDAELALRPPLCVVLDAAVAVGARSALDTIAAWAPGTPVLLYASSDDQLAESLVQAVDGAVRVEVAHTVAQVAERLTLYVLTGMPRSAAASPAPAGRRPEPPRFDGEKILVIDDDIRNVFALTSALELRGLTVLYAGNGREGIEALAANEDVALVLLDVMMPGMDGYATAARIRALDRFADVPIVAVSAKAMKGDREKSLAAGMNEHVSKPVDLDRLLLLIRELTTG